MELPHNRIEGAREDGGSTWGLHTVAWSCQIGGGDSLVGGLPLARSC